MGRRKQAEEILDRLAAEIEQPETELHYADPYQLLVAVILSAQCTDERVNQVTPALFEAFPSVARLAEAEPEDVLPYIASITFPNNKSRHLVGMARRVRDYFGGAIPSGIQDLQTLPGAGRKTAQVVAGAAFGKVDAFPVDTHVFRVAHRLNLARPESATPDAVEQDLRRVVDAARLSDAHHLFILHGRYTCTAQRPRCGTCVLKDICPQWSRLRGFPVKADLERRHGKFWCATRGHYVDHTVPREDRAGVRQESCPHCGSMNLFDTRTGHSLRRVRDVRIGDMGHGRPLTP